MTGINLQSSETRDVGKLTLEVGGQAENVTVGAEVTPIQLASAERSASITGEQLVNIQLKGRDVFGFTSLVPGVLEPTTRDYTTWFRWPAFHQRRAETTECHRRRLRWWIEDRAAALVNPNMDAVSEVKVLSNGFRRSSGGMLAARSASYQERDESTRGSAA
jgi:hypothetical protein